MAPPNPDQLTATEQARLREEERARREREEAERIAREANRHGVKLFDTTRDEPEKDYYHITREMEESLPTFTGDGDISYEEFDRRLKEWLHMMPDNEINQQPFIGRILRNSRVAREMWSKIWRFDLFKN